jgi:hypothetical protein
LNSNVNEEDKRRLILAFTFDEKHICIQDSIKWQIEENKQYGMDELNFFSNCLPTDFLRRDSFESLCMCEYYLENCSVEEFEKHFYKLLDHFYEMRNSEVHRGFPITLDFKKYNNIQKLETVTFSSYITKNGKIIVVGAVDINIYEIFIRAIRNNLINII